MPSKIEASGKILGKVRVTSAKECLESDFILSDRYSFQVVCNTRIAKHLHDGDKITVIGELRENGGDVYIWAIEIIQDKQIELSFD